MRYQKKSIKCLFISPWVATETCHYQMFNSANFES